MDEFGQFLQLMSRIQIVNRPDSLILKPQKIGKFSTRSFFNLLTFSIDRSNSTPTYFPDKTIWKHSAPPKDCIFAWKGVKEKILILDNVIKTGKILVNRCFLCDNDAESCNHILLWCPFTANLWHMVYSLIGINWVMSSSVYNEIMA